MSAGTPGGAVALDRLLAQQRPYLLRFARQRLRDAALAEDAVQETLLAALQGHERFAQQSSLRTWLTGILLNKIADALRREQRSGIACGDAGAAAGDDGDADADDRANDIAVDWLDPERLIAARQSLELLRRRLAQLPAAASRALLLREVDGCSLDEIGRELGLSAGHSAVLLHRARRRLREGLAASGAV